MQSSNTSQIPSEEELRTLLNVAIEAANSGGEVIRSYLGKVTAREKAPADLVTEADLAAQDAIIGVIRRAYPQHEIVAEESGGGGQKPTTPVVMGDNTRCELNPGEDMPGLDAGSESSVYRWYIDPLDGTTNFFHSFPLFAVSVGVQYRGITVAGCIYNPLSGQMFHAYRGGGAWLGDRTLSTSGCSTFAEALVAIALPARVKFDSADFRLFLAAINRCHSIRRTGCTALNLAFTAAGWLDAAWGLSCHSWDLAAGILLVEEAGGVVGDLNRQPFSLTTGRFLAAATPALLEEIYRLAEPLALTAIPGR